MVMVNERGAIAMVNAQTERDFGYHRSEMLGQPIEMLLPARFNDRHPGLRNGFLKNPQLRPMGAGRDLFARRKDGSEFPVEIGLNPIETAAGALVLSAIVDITRPQGGRTGAAGKRASGKGFGGHRGVVGRRDHRRAISTAS